ncbi:hypothetical protein HDZ31DRAFT_59614 [Schizophyllum fasciatum]
MVPSGLPFATLLSRTSEADVRARAERDRSSTSLVPPKTIATRSRSPSVDPGGATPKETSQSWWSTTKQKLSPAKERERSPWSSKDRDPSPAKEPDRQLSPAQRVIEEARAREREEAQARGRERSIAQEGSSFDATTGGASTAASSPPSSDPPVKPLVPPTRKPVPALHIPSPNSPVPPTPAPAPVRPTSFTTPPLLTRSMGDLTRREDNGAAKGQTSSELSDSSSGSSFTTAFMDPTSWRLPATSTSRTPTSPVVDPSSSNPFDASRVSLSNDEARKLPFPARPAAPLATARLNSHLREESNSRGDSRKEGCSAPGGSERRAMSNDAEQVAPKEKSSLAVTNPPGPLALDKSPDSSRGKPTNLSGNKPTDAAPGRSVLPNTVKFSPAGVLDVPATVLEVARRLEKLEVWTVKHVHALEGRIGSVERRLVRNREVECQVKGAERSATKADAKASSELDDGRADSAGAMAKLEGPNLSCGTSHTPKISLDDSSDRANDEHIDGEMASVRTELAKLQGRVSELAQDMAEVARELVKASSIQQDVENARQSDKVTEELGTIVHEVQAVREDLNALGRTTNEVRREVEGAVRKAVDLERKVDVVSREVDRVGRSAGLERQVGDVRGDVQNVTRDVHGVSRDVQNVSRDVHDLRRDVQEVRREVARLSASPCNFQPTPTEVMEPSRQTPTPVKWESVASNAEQPPQSERVLQARDQNLAQEMIEPKTNIPDSILNDAANLTPMDSQPTHSNVIAASQTRRQHPSALTSGVLSSLSSRPSPPVRAASPSLDKTTYQPSSECITSTSTDASSTATSSSTVVTPPSSPPSSLSPDPTGTAAMRATTQAIVSNKLNADPCATRALGHSARVYKSAHAVRRQYMELRQQHLQALGRWHMGYKTLWIIGLTTTRRVDVAIIERQCFGIIDVDEDEDTAAVSRCTQARAVYDRAAFDACCGPEPGYDTLKQCWLKPLSVVA